VVDEVPSRTTRSSSNGHTDLYVDSASRRKRYRRSRFPETTSTDRGSPGAGRSLEEGSRLSTRPRPGAFGSGKSPSQGTTIRPTCCSGSASSSLPSS